MKRRINSFALMVAALFFAAGPVRSAEKVYITGARKMEGDTDGKKIHIQGELVAGKGETKIFAPYLEYDKDSKVGKFTGGVRLVQEDLTVTGEEFVINFDQDRGVFRNNVRLDRRETKNGQGEVEKDHITLTCSVLEINTETKDFTATGGVELQHKDFTASSPRLVYDDAGEKLAFYGGAVLQREKEEVKGREIIIDLKKKLFEVGNGVELVFDVKKEEETSGTEPEN